jgi:hypothetical protein
MLYRINPFINTNMIYISILNLNLKYIKLQIGALSCLLPWVPVLGTLGTY